MMHVLWSLQNHYKNAGLGICAAALNFNSFGCFEKRDHHFSGLQATAEPCEYVLNILLIDKFIMKLRIKDLFFFINSNSIVFLLDFLWAYCSLFNKNFE